MNGIVSSYDKVGRALAENAAEVLLNGKKPTQVPSRSLPTDMQSIVINAKTVEAVGLEIPYGIIELAEIVEN